MNWFSCLCFIYIFLHYATQSFASPLPRHRLCRLGESAALVEFRSSFSIEDYEYSSSSCENDFGVSDPNSTTSWDAGTDCCTWRGVTCDRASGHVTSLNLRCGGLRGALSPNSSLFSLTSLRTLILSRNDFEGSEIPSGFGKLQQMVHLDLSYSNFRGRVPVELAYLSNLDTLDLCKNSDLIVESSSLKPIVANLTCLRKLVLSLVNMSNVAPDSFMNLSASLISLDFTRSGLSGEFPEKIFNLENLEDLRLDNNKDLFGSFPKNNWTSSLTSLGLSNTGFLVDLGYLTRTLDDLNVLFVNKCKIVGLFPSVGLKLKNVTSLGIASNNVSGRIPWEALSLQKLTYLDLASNNFVGELPEICSNSEGKDLLCEPSNNQFVGSVPMNLKSLLLSHNLLHGKIPSWIYSLPFLEELSLGHNNLTGRINEFRMKTLTVLQLRSNKLEGPIPASIFEQRNLSWLDLSKNNLSGDVMFEQISKLKHLKLLALSFNRLTLVSTNHSNHTLPKTLSTLRLSSCNISEFPYSLRSVEHLGTLDLSRNRIQGSVPEWLWSVGKDSLYNLNISNNQLTHVGRVPWNNLQLIDLDSNHLEGPLPIPPLSTILYSASKNQFSGKIPSWVCDLSSIQVLNLANNRLSGNIPLCIGNFSKFLSVLDLRANSLHGMIPPTFAKGNSLMTLNLNGNRLEGQIPESLLNCKSLQVFDLGNNSLNGSFPRWLESFSKLQVLILGSNKFHGLITPAPKNRFPFKRLRILDISNNSFSGLLPEKYFESFEAMKTSHRSNLEYMEKYVSGGYFYRDSVRVVIKGFYTELVKIQSEFITIDCSSNRFTGKIPQVVGDLHALKGLSLSHNKLSGVISAALGNLTNLESLDLSSNRLSGKIPIELASKLTQLEFLNLSWNSLEGEIPRGPQFDTFNEDAFRGNPKLCGFPLPKPCEHNKSREEESGHSDSISFWDMVIIGFGSGLVIGVSVGYMVLFNRSFDYWLMEMFDGGWRRYAKSIFRGRREDQTRS